MREKLLFRSVATLAALLLLVSTAQAVIIETVPVGDPDNEPDDEVMSGDGTTGYGSVDHTYRIGKHEVTNSQYVEMLNAVATVGDANGLYNTEMGSGWNDIGGISRTGSGTSGDPWVYAVRTNRTDRPVNYVSWGDAARFANWMHNGQPTGAQDLSTTEDGAYFLDGATTDAALLAVTREADWKWAIPTEDEWYKAAYYKSGGTSAEYWAYPTQSDTVPAAELPPGVDMTNGSANYRSAPGIDVDPNYYTTEVGAYDAKPSDSAYRTFDQGGNVWEWNEAIVYDAYRGLRGGSFLDDGGDLRASRRDHIWPTYEIDHIGFRVASILLLADMNGDLEVDHSDVAPFIDHLLAGWFHLAADMNADGMLNGRDVAPFVAAVQGGGDMQAVPEPATLWLTAIGLLCVLWRRKVAG